MNTETSAAIGHVHGSYYVYALLDPRMKPASPFYVGKGHGSRKDQHLNEDTGSSAKSSRIQAIRAEGLEPIASELVTNLSESQALLLEAQLIAAFGTESSGGSLTNLVVPTGYTGSRAKDLVMPWGILERSQAGLSILKQSVLELADANPTGITNADVASALGLRSDYMGGSKDYLSFSLLGLLLKEGRLIRVGKKYQVPKSAPRKAPGNETT